MSLITFKHFKGDLFGGITAGVVALPLALAFGIQAFGSISTEAVPNIGAIAALAGLVGAIMLGFFASLLGGTETQISGPTGAMTVVTASLISGLWVENGSSIETFMITMSVTGILCGLFQVLYGVLRIGKYIRYIPYPVLSGFMSSIGIIIIMQQIHPLLGMKAPSSIIEIFANLPKDVPHLNWQSVVLGVGTILIIYFLPKLTKKIPAALVALVGMTVVSVFMDYPTALTIGEIPSGFPLPFFAEFSMDSIQWGTVMKTAFAPALTLSALGSIETLLTSVVTDNITKTKHNSNKELIGQGIGNMMAGMFAGIAGTGATMRTMVNVKNGGKTRLSGIIHALFLVTVLLGLGRFVQYIPLSVLSGILITVGINILDLKGLKDMLKIPRTDAFILIIVMILTVFVDLLVAVGIGVTLACFFLMKRTSDFVEESYTVDVIHNEDKEMPWSDEKGLMGEDMLKQVYIMRLDGPVFFGSITGFQNATQRIPAEAKVVIMRMRKVSYLDQSGLYAIETAVKDLQARGVMVLMTIIQPQPMQQMKRLKILPGLIPWDHTFENFKDCADFLKKMI